MSVSNDKEILISIVHEMTKSRSGLQSTKHWAEDALWYDIPLLLPGVFHLQ